MEYKVKNFSFLELLRAGAPTKTYHLNCMLVLALAKKHKEALSLVAQKSDVQQAISLLIEELPLQKPIIDYLMNEFEFYNSLIAKQQLSQFLLSIVHIPEEEYKVFVQTLSNTLLNKLDGHLMVPDVISEVGINYLQEEFETSGTFYDGMAGLGEKAFKFKNKFQQAQVKVQELDLYAASILSLHSYMFEQFMDVKLGDVVLEPLLTHDENLEQFDRVFMTAPFGLKLSKLHQDMIECDPYNRFVFGKPHKTQGDFTYLSCGLSAVKEDGKAAFLLPGGALSRSGPEKVIRQNLVMFDMIEAIVYLPAILPWSTVSPVLVLCSKKKPKKHPGKILMVNAETFKEEKRGQAYIPEDKAQLIIDTVRNYEESEGVSRLVAIDEIKNTILSPDKYVFAKKTFSNELGHIEFDMQEIEQLKTVQLRDIATFFRGYNALSNEEDANGDYAVLKIADVINGQIIMDNLMRYNIESERKIASSRIQKGDLVISIRGAKRKIALFEEDLKNILISQNFAGIRCKPDWNPKFLQIYFESPVAQLYFDQHTTGSTILNLPMKDLEKMPIPALSIEKQNEIVESFEQEQTEIARQIAALEVARNQSKLAAYSAMGLEKAFVVR